MQARPLFRDRKRFSQMVDPLLEGKYPVRGLYQALAIAAMCVQEQPNLRPVVADVVTALNYLASNKYDPSNQHVQNSKIPPSQRVRRDDDDDHRHSSRSEHETEDHQRVRRDDDDDDNHRHSSRSGHGTEDHQ